MSYPEIIPGCPRHTIDGFDRNCVDARCQRHWSPTGAPTPTEQLAQWVAGKAICPNTNHECTPDFGCCRPELLWPVERRQKYAEAEQGEREKMLMSSLGAVVAASDVKVHVTRGEPIDHE